MRWYFDGGNHAYADSILQQLEVGSGTAIVPVLWRYEVSAVLSRAQIKGLLTADKAAEFLEDIAALNIIVDAESADHVLTDVYHLATRYRLTAYDASYLELALRRALSLATLDVELQVACKAAGIALR